MFIQFAELPVFDQDRAKAFYVDKLGCEVVADAAMGRSDWRWIEVRLPGAQTSMHFVRRPDEAPSKGPVLVFIAEDLRSAVREIESRGVRPVRNITPAQYDAGREVAEIDDSEGNRIVISSR